jgi:DNA-binding transcriptional regulator YbjK
MSDQSISYRGRKASRTRSEQRRRNILEAALRIVVTEGVRGVRHRAVAKEADVPLSATTYYFDDIHALIADTFTLFAESAMEDVVDPIYAEVEDFIRNNRETFEKDPAARGQLVERMAMLITLFIQNEVNEKRDHLMAEQAFMHECLRDPHLREIARSYFDHLVNQLRGLSSIIGLKDPDIAGDILMGTVFRIEYEALIAPAGSFDFDRARRTLEMLLRGLVATSTQ